MWTDTVTPERLWADTHDLWWDMLQRPRTDFRRRISLGPGPAARAATLKVPWREENSTSRRWLRVHRLGRLFLHLATVSKRRAG